MVDPCAIIYYNYLFQVDRDWRVFAAELAVHQQTKWLMKRWSCVNHDNSLYFLA